MSSWGVRKPTRTYSRTRKHLLCDEEPPTKRRRVEEGTITVEEDIVPSTPCRLSSDASPTHNVPAMLASSPKEIPQLFSEDEPIRSTPPSSPVLQTSSPPLPARRSKCLSLKRKPQSPPKTVNYPLSERSLNVKSPTDRRPKKKRLIQMQLDLVGELRKTCKLCGMEYIPSNAEDATLHRKFHAMNVGGVDFSKACIEKLRQNQVWAGGDGSFITVIGRKDTLALRNKALEILKVVNTELAAVAIPTDALWSQLQFPLGEDAAAQSGNRQKAASGRQTLSTCDRFKVYLHIRANKCVGACLAERILEAYSVLDQDDAAQRTGHAPVGTESSSISIGTVVEPALLGISRIWTSNLYRKRGIATTLLDVARSDFLYGMNIGKDMVAFSQPTESGGKLARKWFGRRAGWHVYID